MKRHYIFLLFLLSLMIVGGVDVSAQTPIVPNGCSNHITSGSTIGSTSAIWWQSFSPFYKLNPGESIVFNFTQKSASNREQDRMIRSWVLIASDIDGHASKNEGNIGAVDEIIHIQPNGTNADTTPLNKIEGASLDMSANVTPGNIETWITRDGGVEVTVRVSLLNDGTTIKIYTTFGGNENYVSYIQDMAKAIGNAEERVKNWEWEQKKQLNYDIGAPLYLFFALQGTELSNFTAEYSKWDIFEETTTSETTWNGMRVSKNFNKDTQNWNKIDNTTNDLYTNKNNLSKEQITVGEFGLFNGVLFTATAGNLQLCPRDYRIFLNGNKSENQASFTLKNVPAGSYIWIKAESNSTDDGVYFTLNDGNGYTRYDDNQGEAEEEKGKHMFCYKVDTKKDYTIIPSRACYIYYIAVKTNPLPILKFENETVETQDISNGTHTQTVTNAATCVINDGDETSVEVTYSSDDETVATVDENGEVTCVGKGTATITATMSVGTSYTLANNAKADANRTFVLDDVVTASYEVTVTDSRVFEHKITNQVPAIWTPFYPQVQEGDKLVDKKGLITMYLAGWKYQQSDHKISDTKNENNYLSPLYLTTKDYIQRDGKNAADWWELHANKFNYGLETAKDFQAVAIDGFENYLEGKKNNGKSEFFYKDKLLPGDYVLEFKERNPSLQEDNHVANNTEKINQEEYVQGKGNPFTVPTMGAFLKFEPEQNGTLTVYILQNGSIDFDSNNNRLVGNVSWRPIYIVDEAGNRLLDKDVKAITKQNILVSRNDKTRDCYTKDGDDGVLDTKPFGDAIETENSRDATTLEHIYLAHQSIFDNPKFWPRRGTPESVLGPNITGDGWVIISKGYVKYQFPVKAGKSYYMFANKAKIIYSGYSFLPDDVQPTETITLNSKDNDMQTADELKKVLGGEKSKTVKSVTVKHKFHEGWNSICLPFSITESKMRELFGSETIKSNDDFNDKKKEDYELVIFNGCTKVDEENNTDKVHFFHHVYQDIVAGYPYMIYINKNAKVLTDKSGTFTVDNVTIENVDRVKISSSEQYMPNGSDFEKHSPIKDYTFTGVYEPTQIAKNSYCVVANGIHIYDAITMPGYRAYLHPSYQDKNNNSEVKRITATNLSELGYFWDEANPIKSILPDEDSENEFSAPSDVYSVSGMLVRKNTTSLDGLPKGIYIVNGKKYFVK